MPQTAYYRLGRFLGRGFSKSSQENTRPSLEELAKYYGGMENLKHPAARDYWVHTRYDNLIRSLLYNKANPAMWPTLVNHYKNLSESKRVAPLLALISSLSNIPHRELLKKTDVVPVDAPFIEDYITEFANRVPPPGKDEIDESAPLENQYFSTKPSLFGKASLPFKVRGASELGAAAFDPQRRVLYETSPRSIEATLHELGHASGSPRLNRIMQALTLPESIISNMSFSGMTQKALAAKMANPKMKGHRLFPLKAYAVTRAITALPRIAEEARASYLGRKAYERYGKKQGPGYQLAPTRFWMSPASIATSSMSQLGDDVAGSLARTYKTLQEQKLKDNAIAGLSGPAHR